MATLTIEGIPAGLLNRLASAAVANGRCLNSEAILSLVRHVRAASSSDACAPGSVIVCPLAACPRSEAPRRLNAAWGDPG